MRSTLRRFLVACVETWQFTAVGIGSVAIVTMLVLTAQSVSEVAQSRGEVEAGLALAVAEQHAQDFAMHVGCSDQRMVGGLRSSLVQRRSGDRRWIEIEVAVPKGRSYSFMCEILSGSLPPTLRRPLSVLGEVNRSLFDDEFALSATKASDFPRVDLSACNRRDVTAAGCKSFVHDVSIALLHLRNGTDQSDYRLEADPDGVLRPRFGESGILVVDGNLWVERGRGTLQIELARPATLVVRGNVYLGRSLACIGSGRLTIVAEASDIGEWSEGSGNVFLGLVEDDAKQVVSIDASLVATSDCVVSSNSATVLGAVVVGGDLIATHEESRLVVAGTRLPHSREPNPGIVRRGSRRPSVLVPVAVEDQSVSPLR